MLFHELWTTWTGFFITTVNIVKMVSFYLNVTLATRSGYASRVRWACVLKSGVIMLDVTSSLIVIEESMSFWLPPIGVNDAPRVVHVSRWINWLVTTPMMLLDLLLLTNAKAVEIALVMLLEIEVIVLGASAHIAYEMEAFWTGFLLALVIYFMLMKIVVAIICDMSWDDELKPPVQKLATLLFLSWSYYPVSIMIEQITGFREKAVLNEVATFVSKTLYTLSSVLIYMVYQNRILAKEDIDKYAVVKEIADKVETRAFERQTKVSKKKRFVKKALSAVQRKKKYYSRQTNDSAIVDIPGAASATDEGASS